MRHDDEWTPSRSCELVFQERLRPLELGAGVTGRKTHAATPGNDLEIVHRAGSGLHRLCETVGAEKSEVRPQRRADDGAAGDLDGLAFEKEKATAAGGGRRAKRLDRAFDAALGGPPRSIVLMVAGDQD